ncbi:hypothetical protein HAHE_36370 [Haloferula helveola]|uniref:Concanavalin A-like lectin/glucanases superfamily protein n=1 Tax=Haloferula helveola TaxID=490095 RepID=A0ABM7RNZ7_9BACT|nr:hypothetical protein HAHE_36370 [Haloferula helveola]
MRRVLPILTLALAGVAFADQLTVTDGGTLTGEVLSMGTDGVLSMRAAVAKDPVRIRAESVRKVAFASASSKPGDHDAKVTLTNGDVIPCDLTGVDDKRLTVSTPFAGLLEIDRKFVSHVQLGIRPRRLIYSGVGKLDDWSASDDWRIDDGKLIASGRGSIGRDYGELPDSFALSFLLEWTRRPNFKVYFCSEDTSAGGGKHDRYYLQFASAGFELKRQSSGKTTYHTLGMVNRAPEAFPDDKVTVDLRIDRASKMILLYLNGELEGRFPDRLDDVPQGRCVAFLSSGSGDDHLSVSQIDFREWDSAGDRHKSEERGEKDVDAVIDHDGQRFSGKLLRAAEKDSRGIFLFKSPHFPQPLEIPADRVSTLFFAKGGDEPPSSPLVFGLNASGTLSASGCRFDGDTMNLIHPLLGEIAVSREAVESLDRREEPETEEETDEPEADEP